MSRQPTLHLTFGNAESRNTATATVSNKRETLEVSGSFLPNSPLLSHSGPADMTSNNIHCVTGAYGYSGKYIADKLLAKGHKVMTLTNSMNRENPFAGRVEAHPFHFDRPDLLTESLKGVRVLYNTYWVRFNHREFTYQIAIRNTKILFQAAKEVGLERIVHISITNPSENSELGYFKGKAMLERMLKETGISYTVLRPAVLFGKEDILINNIAWALRRFPLFGLFGLGGYRLQPIFVEDLAELAVLEGERRENVIIDTIGPETFTYRELVEAIGRIIARERPLIPMPPFLAFTLSWLIGKFMKDVVITRDEIKGLMAELLHVESASLGRTRLTDWAKQSSDTLGLRYTSEMARRRDRTHSYCGN